MTEVITSAQSARDLAIWLRHFPNLVVARSKTKEAYASAFVGTRSERLATSIPVPTVDAWIAEGLLIPWDPRSPGGQANPNTQSYDWFILTEAGKSAAALTTALEF